VYGNPLTVVARMANSLAEDAEYLRAGQILWSGTVCPPTSLQPGGMSPENLAAMPVYGSEAFEGHPYYARADFTRLGSVTMRFAPPEQ
jgi:2-keto-4-pentenoate hydratase